jgi:hypothetical protein
MYLLRDDFDDVQEENELMNLLWLIKEVRTFLLIAVWCCRH